MEDAPPIYGMHHEVPPGAHHTERELHCFVYRVVNILLLITMLGDDPGRLQDQGVKKQVREHFRILQELLGMGNEDAGALLIYLIHESRTDILLTEAHSFNSDENRIRCTRRVVAFVWLLQRVPVPCACALCVWVGARVYT